MNRTWNTSCQLTADITLLGGKLHACKKVLALSAVTFSMLATSAEAASVHRSKSPIKDSSGRVEVIVDFDFDPDTDTEFDDVIRDSQYEPWAGHRTKAIKF